MKWIGTVGLVSVLGLCACSMHDKATPAIAGDAAAAPTPVVAGTIEEGTVTVTATVEAVDQAKRTVTLKGPKGNLVTVKADERVKNFAQIKKGDLVAATYYESLAYEVRKPGQGEPGIAVAQDVVTAKPGQKPGAAGAQSMVVTATIQAIDKTNNTVTLKGPEGNLTQPIKVKDPSKLDKVKVGDLVEITYTEALAVAVESAKK